MKKAFRSVCNLILLGIITLSLCGCEIKGKEVVFTTGFAGNEVFRINDLSCSEAEVLVYLTNIQNAYEGVYGAHIWESEHDGVILSDDLKESVLARIAGIKSMYLLSVDKGIELTESEKEKVKKAASEYYGSLSKKEKNLLGVSEDLIEEMYTEYALSDKVYRTLISDINPEISDDEARTIIVQVIFIASDNRDSTAETSYGKRKAYNKAMDVYRLATEEGADFATIAAQYSDDDELIYSLGREYIEDDGYLPAFDLSNGEISNVSECIDGYRIFKCVSAFDREETELNKEKIIEKRRREAFSEEYDVYVETLRKQFNEELWKDISLIRDEEVDTSDFFEIIDKAIS
ncbi:MAG: peptidylprolyl isomerase [Lachnospiraceae bacterium]|nr:peptidylprolyl isomerase [Lachnospiraceae bacterium]